MKDMHASGLAYSLVSIPFWYSSPADNTLSSIHHSSVEYALRALFPPIDQSINQSID